MILWPLDGGERTATGTNTQETITEMWRSSDSGFLSPIRKVHGNLEVSTPYTRMLYTCIRATARTDVVNTSNLVVVAQTQPSASDADALGLLECLFPNSPLTRSRVYGNAPRGAGNFHRQLCSRGECV
jgi:hypothetical protein